MIRVAKVDSKIQSVARALDILDAIADVSTGARLSELSSRLGLNASTCHHLVETMIERGYVTQDPESKRFYLGPKIARLSSAYQESSALVRLAAPWLEELNSRSGELVTLGVLTSAGHLVRVAKLDGLHHLRVSGKLWENLDPHCTGVGKAILAYLPDEDVERLVRQYGLPRRTAQTMTTVEVLRAELRRIRERGISFDNEETYEGVACVGGPIWNQAGRVIAAASVSMPVVRFTPARVGEVAGLVTDACRAISLALGYSGARSDSPTG